MWLIMHTGQVLLTQDLGSLQFLVPHLIHGLNLLQFALKVQNLTLLLSY